MEKRVILYSKHIPDCGDSIRYNMIEYRNRPRHHIYIVHFWGRNLAPTKQHFAICESILYRWLWRYPNDKQWSSIFEDITREDYRLVDAAEEKMFYLWGSVATWEL